MKIRNRKNKEEYRFALKLQKLSGAFSRERDSTVPWAIYGHDKDSFVENVHETTIRETAYMKTRKL